MPLNHKLFLLHIFLIITSFLLQMDLAKIDIRPYQVGPLLAAPRTLALLFAGAATYITFIDPNVRNSLEQTRQKLKHWSLMYTQSKSILELLCATATLTSVACYFKTKQNLWLIGGALMASIFPYAYLVLKNSSCYLADTDKKLDPKIEMSLTDKLSVLQNLKSWSNLHVGKVVIAFLAISTFYLAELKSTDKVDASVILT